jgi:hypothetical protein
MSLTVLRLIAPVIWAVVSAVIAIVLIKTSETYFEKIVRSKGQRITLQLSGSIVIACLAYYGMWKATGSFDSILVDPVALHQLREDIVRVDRQALELQACVETAGEASCGSKVNDLKARTTSLAETAKSLTSQ